MTSPKAVRVRPMIVGDLDQVIALERKSDGAPRWNRADYLQAIECFEDSALRRLALVAEVDENLGAFAVVRLLNTPDGTEAELESIAVDPELRGQGVGTALLAEAIRQIGVQGVRRLDLEVRASNATAMRLYDRLGARETGRRLEYYRDPDEDAVLMRINL